MKARSLTKADLSPQKHSDRPLRTEAGVERRMWGEGAPVEVGWGSPSP